MTVHWTIPFKSLNETPYVIFIYEDGYNGSPVALTGAESPFETNEQDDTDIFTPMRSQTGYIRLIDTDGTLMEQLMPKSATSHYVQVKQGATVVWQGFLTDEAYSQDWDNQPKQIDIAVRSILGVMDAIPMPNADSSMHKSVSEIVSSIVTQVSTFTPSPVFTSIVYPDDSPNALTDLHLYLTNFYDFVKQMNDGHEETSVSGNSLATVITAICSFMGWECRENGTTLYFTTIDSARDKSSTALTNLTFVNNSHTQGFSRGSRSVEISASVNQMEGSDFINISLPEVLTSSGITEIEKARGYYKNADWNIVFTADDYSQGQRTKFYMLAQTNANMDPNIGFVNSQYVLCRSNTWQNSIMWTGGPIQISRLLQWIALMESTDSTFLYTRAAMVAEFNFPEWWNTSDNRTRYTGGFFAKLDIWKEGDEHYENKPASGVYLCAVPPFFNPPTGQYDYLMEMWSENFVAAQGYFNIQFSGTFINPYGVVDNVVGGSSSIKLALKHGNRWWNGTNWVDTFATFDVTIQEGGKILTNKTADMPVSGNQGWYIPTEEGNAGYMVLYFMMRMDVYQRTSFKQGTGQATTHCNAWDVFVRSFGVEFLSTSTYKTNDNSENTYFRIIDMHSADTKKVDLKLATDNNNKEGFGIIRNSDLTKPTSWQYYTGTGTATETKRPELHLLDRMATYYSKVRRWLKVKVQHPDLTLPSTRITHGGITYAPVAESRNWRDDESELTLTEIPT